MGNLTHLTVKTVVPEALAILDSGRRGPYTCIALAMAIESLTGHYPGVFHSLVVQEWERYCTAEGNGTLPDWWESGSLTAETKAERKEMLMRWMADEPDCVVF